MLVEVGHGTVHVPVGRKMLNKNESPNAYFCNNLASMTTIIFSILCKLSKLGI